MRSSHLPHHSHSHSNNMHKSNSLVSSRNLFQQTIVLALLVQIVFLLGSAYYFLHQHHVATTTGGASPQSHSLFHNLYPPPPQPLQTTTITSAQQQQQQEQKVFHVNLKHPLAGMIQHYPNGPHHDPTKRRHCFTFTAVPSEVTRLLTNVQQLLDFDRYAQVLDCVHISIPHFAMRFSEERYPTTAELQQRLTDPRVIFHRLPDYGPMTRYIGPIAYEQHPESSMILFDIDSSNMMSSVKDLVLLFFAARQMDANAIWCFQGEDFLVDGDQVTPVWDTFPAHTWKNAEDLQYEWNQCHFCRGVGGMLFKPKHFVDFWYNQSEYHASCFFDDDRWVSYQMDRQGFPLKVIHPTSNLLDLKYLLATKDESDENPSAQQQRQRRRLLVNSTMPSLPPPFLQQDPAWDITTNNYTSALRLLGHRRLGSLTQITKQLKSDVTCALAWMNKHPNAYPSARADNYYQSHPRPGQANIKRRVQQLEKENHLENQHLREPRHLVVRRPDQLQPDHLHNLFPDQAFMNKRNPDHWIMGDHAGPNNIQHKDMDADRLERINQLVKEKGLALANLS